MTTYYVNMAVQMQLRHCMFTVHVHRAMTAGYKSASTVWISVKFGIPGKIFSRRIQCHMLQRTRITTYGKRRKLPKLHHSDHSGDFWSISHPDSSYLDVPLSALDILLQLDTDLGEVWVILGQKYDFH